MADLNQSLRKKRAELVAEQEQLTADLHKTQQRLGDVNGAIAGIDAVLKLEEPEAPASGNASEADVPKDLQAFLFAALAGRTRSTPDLVEEATRRGFDFEGKNPHRTIGFTLLGIKKGGRVQRLEDGRWRLSNQ